MWRNPLTIYITPKLQIFPIEINKIMNDEVTNKEVANNTEPNNAAEAVPELSPEQIKKQIKLFQQLMRRNRGKHSMQRRNNGGFGKAKHK